jgi:hypothetical protein
MLLAGDTCEATVSTLQQLLVRQACHHYRSQYRLACAFEWLV